VRLPEKEVIAGDRQVTLDVELLRDIANRRAGRLANFPFVREGANEGSKKHRLARSGGADDGQ